MNSRAKNLLFWVVVGLFMILLFNLFSVPTHAPEEDVIFSEFMAKLDKGDVERVIIKASHISAVLKDKTRIRTYSVEYPELVVHYVPCDLGAVCVVPGVVVLLDAANADGGQ
jgi:cell division protease FtsH